MWGAESVIIIEAEVQYVYDRSFSQETELEGSLLCSQNPTTCVYAVLIVPCFCQICFNIIL